MKPLFSPSPPLLRTSSPPPLLTSSPLLLLLLLLTACLSTPTPTPLPDTPAPPASVIVDGQFDDWEAIPPAYRDPAGDAGPSGVDFTIIRLAHTPDLLLIQIDLGTPLNLQTDPGVVLFLDTDADPEADLVYDFAARQGTFEGAPIGQADLRVVPAPSIAAAQTEIAIPLDVLPDSNTPLFGDAPLRVRLADPAADGDTAPDDQGWFEYAWSQPLPPPTALPLAKDPAAVRVVSYNVERDGILSIGRKEYFQRILTALQPDVIALQEVNNRPASAVEARIEEWLGGEWYALKQRDLVTLSRYPIVEGWPPARKPLHDRLFPLLLDVNGQPLLVINAHLSCCGADDERQQQADSLIAFLRNLRETGDLPPDTPLLLLGDFNLVGGPQPLTTLLTGDIRDEAAFGPDHPPDADQSPLTALFPRHATTSLSYTWRSDDSEFAPGKLDYIMYSDSLLSVANSFVLFTPDMPPELLAQYDLQAQDALEASDHFPVVADVQFREVP